MIPQSETKYLQAKKNVLPEVIKYLFPQKDEVVPVQNWLLCIGKESSLRKSGYFVISRKSNFKEINKNPAKKISGFYAL
jgi:hypothetical protein